MFPLIYYCTLTGVFLVETLEQFLTKIHYVQDKHLNIAVKYYFTYNFYSEMNYTFSIGNYT